MSPPKHARIAFFSIWGMAEFTPNKRTRRIPVCIAGQEHRPTVQTFGML